MYGTDKYPSIRTITPIPVRLKVEFNVCVEKARDSRIFVFLTKELLRILLLMLGLSILSIP